MKTINLLPKPRQAELRYEAMLRSLWIVCWMTFGSFAVVFLVQFGLKFYLTFEAGSIKSQIQFLQAQVNRQQNSDVKDKVANVNNLISDYNGLAQSSPKWSRLIMAFAPLIPDNVRVNSLTVDPGLKTVNVNGISPTRELVIQIYNNILNDKKDFFNIDYPLENVAKPTDVNFHFTFYYQDDLVK